MCWWSVHLYIALPQDWPWLYLLTTHTAHNMHRASCQFSLILQKESSLKINHSFHVLMNKFHNLSNYGNFVPIFMLNLILNTSLVVVQDFPNITLNHVLSALSTLLVYVRYKTLILRISTMQMYSTEESLSTPFTSQQFSRGSLLYFSKVVTF